MSRIIIGLHGHACSGKDTVADIFSQHFSYKKLAFASKMKEACEILFGVDPYFYEQNRCLKEKPLPFWNKSPREIWQLFGTEAMRNTFGEDFWLRVMEKHLLEETRNRFVISDCRFQNEIDWILKNNGVIIHLTRPGSDGKVGISEHASEQRIDLSDYPSHQVFGVYNNDSINELRTKIRQLIFVIESRYSL